MHLRSELLYDFLMLNQYLGVTCINIYNLLKPIKVIPILGRRLPPLTVKSIQARKFDPEIALTFENQDLKYDGEFHGLDAFPKDFDVGKYIFDFKVVLNYSDDMGRYKQVGRSRFEVYVTGEIKVENVEIAILDTDLGNVEPPKKLNLSAESSVSLLANHLQKLRLSFQLVSPLGNAFEPNQVLLKLRHETNIEHVFLVGNSGKEFEIILDFLGLMDKLYYLSGKYNLQLIVGDAVMENSFLCSLGHIDLDLPKVPNKATRPPPQPTDPLLRFAPKPEITHIFRAAEKCALMKLYLAFLVLVLVPLAGFLIGLCRLGVNLMNFPASRVAATYAVLFHVGIAAILCFYVLFWLQLNIFTMLRILFFLGIFVVYVGHKTLSKLKFS